MKLITLNIWGGHVKGPLLEFVRRHQETDIFCFQEVYHNASRKVSDEERIVHLDIFGQLMALLPNHQPFFRPVVDNLYGIGMFIKKDIDVLEEGEINIYENPAYSGIGPMHSRNLQWAKCLINKQIYSVMNVHALWNGKGKTDAPERIIQSQKIRDFIESVKTPFILCGDFNLRPDTESIKILGQGLTNLIQLHNITSTRTSFYPKDEKFADYIFTSPDITVNRFEVLKDEVSDHSPLFIEL